MYLFRFFILCFLSGIGLSVFSQVEFIENKGQWDARVKFKSEAGDGSFFLEEKGYTIAQYNADDLNGMREGMHVPPGIRADREGPSRVRSHAYRVEFVGASVPQITGEKPIQTYNNYIIGDDPSKWVSKATIYQAVTYKNIYPGIDIRYFMDEGLNLKYDFILHPGAKVSDIALKYSGAEKLEVQKRELVVTTSLGKNRSLRPYTYQLQDNGRQEVDCKYEIKNDVVRFKVANYDPTKILVIDPTLVFFTYSGSSANNFGFTATFGVDGSFFGGGIVFGQGFPVSPGAYGQAFGGGQYDIGIIKLSPDGRNRIYATYIGGSGQEQPHSLVADNQGNLILAGRTNSGNYPVVPARDAATSGPGGGYDIVVSKLSADGSALIGSMRIGGSGLDGVNIGDREDLTSSSLRRNYGDDARSEVLLDNSGNIYVASCTQSTDFPTTPGAAQRNRIGKQDAVLLKLNPSCQNILFSTRLGGTEDDAAYVLTVGANNDVYVAGATKSKDFLGIPNAGVIGPKFNEGEIDGFVVVLNDQGSIVKSGTYVGTNAIDEVYGIDVDNLGYPYIMGTTHGSMPVINANYSNAGAKQFIWKMEPDLSSIIYATVYGSTNSGAPNISPTAFMVDRCENVYVSGWGGKANSSFAGGNVLGMPVTADAVKGTADASGSDFHFFVLEKNAASQLYGTFFGQRDPPAGASPVTYGDHVDGGTSRFDSRGYIYQSMCFQHIPGQPFNGTAGSWSMQNKVSDGGYSIGMLKIEMDFTGVRANLQVVMDGVPNDTIGCIPQLVEFRDIEKSSKGVLFYWDFGDGTGDTTTVQNTSHNYTLAGSYLVRLISIDSSTCNIADTVYQRIYLNNNRVMPDFDAIKLPPCENLTYQFTNTTTETTGQPFKPNIFKWDFGDNSTFLTNSFGDPVTHTYAATGTYNVKLTVSDTLYCNSPADTVKVIRISPIVKASFETPAVGCAPYEAKFDNTSQGGISFLWDFGDGTTGTDDSPMHLYNTLGTYTITLTASDPASCNLTDVTTFAITVSEKPTAAFDFQPTHPIENVFTEFSNHSIGAISYLWDFGDGDTSSQLNPRHVFPATGTYNVCLTAINQYACPDVVCHDVQALISPLLDVPNAFTPGKFGVNSTIGVEGFGIQEMQWTIYNRWGQKVFESNDPKTRWDGTFKGKALPMDVYSYTLRATLVSGERVTKTGDITLIR